MSQPPAPLRDKASLGRHGNGLTGACAHAPHKFAELMGGTWLEMRMRPGTLRRRLAGNAHALSQLHLLKLTLVKSNSFNAFWKLGKISFFKNSF